MDAVLRHPGRPRDVAPCSGRWEDINRSGGSPSSTCHPTCPGPGRWAGLDWCTDPFRCVSLSRRTHIIHAPVTKTLNAGLAPRLVAHRPVNNKASSLDPLHQPPSPSIVLCEPTKPIDEPPTLASLRRAVSDLQSTGSQSQDWVDPVAEKERGDPRATLHSLNRLRSPNLQSSLDCTHSRSRIQSAFEPGLAFLYANALPFLSTA